MVKTIQIAKNAHKRFGDIHLVSMHKRGERIKRLRMLTILTCISCFCITVQEMDDPFIPQCYYQINDFCSGQYRTSCACLIQKYRFIHHTCFLCAPAELQISVPELVNQRTY